MKSLAIITLALTGLFFLAYALLTACGVRVHPTEPVAACIIAVGAGLAGMLPIVLGHRTDPVGIFQLALIGTVLHLLASVALAGIALAAHLVAIKTTFTFWLMAGYFLSLIALVWQLRRVLYISTGLAKA